jgi:hypothetical protein
MTPQQTDNSWDKDASLVLHRLNTIDDELKEMNKRLSHLERSVWSLQAKAAVMGGVAGLIISGIGLLMRVAG